MKPKTIILLFILSVLSLTVFSLQEDVLSPKTNYPGTRSGLFESEPQLLKNNVYQNILNEILYGEYVSQESIKRREALFLVGGMLEKFARQELKNENVKIAIIPRGSVLRGYASENSDIEYAIMIMDIGDNEDIYKDGDEDERIYDEANTILMDYEYFADDMLSLIGLIDLRDCLNGDLNFDQLSLKSDFEDEIFRFSFIFFPVIYGDSQVIEKIRYNIIQSINKSSKGKEYWNMILNVIFSRMHDESIKNRNKEHYNNWLIEQKIPISIKKNSLRTIMRRKYRFPTLEQMCQIYSIDTFSEKDNGRLIKEST